MDKLISQISGAGSFRNKNDDDFADRLSSKYTVIIFVVFAILVGLNQYVREPITCWSPVHFTDSHKKFARDYCWVKNTYYLQFSKKLSQKEEYMQHIKYYQWIPFILLFQAVLFYLPSLVWHGLNQKGGIDADNILSTAHTSSMIEKVDDRDSTLDILINQIDRFLVGIGNGASAAVRDRGKPSKNGDSKNMPEIRSNGGASRDANANWQQPPVAIEMSPRYSQDFDSAVDSQKSMMGSQTEEPSTSSNTCCAQLPKIFQLSRSGRYLLLVYLFSKILYIANAVGQFFLLSLILAFDFKPYGHDMIRDGLQHRDWTEDRFVAFPRVTLCDFRIRGQDMTNVHPYTLQCVLPINLYNEKMYVFIWYWILFVALVSIIGCLFWLLRAISAKDKRSFINNHLTLCKKLEDAEKKQEAEDTKKVADENKRQQENAADGNKAADKSLDKTTEKHTEEKEEKETIEKDEEQKDEKEKKKEPLAEITASRIKQFTGQYLKQDGSLLLRLIAHNVDAITTADIIGKLWNHYWKKFEPKDSKENKKQEEKQDANPDDSNDNTDRWRSSFDDPPTKSANPTTSDSPLVPYS